MKTKLNKSMTKKISRLLIISIVMLALSFSGVSCTIEKQSNPESLENTETKLDSSEPVSKDELQIVDSSKPTYSYAEMQEDIYQLKAKYGDKISYEIIGQSLDGRNLYAIVIGNPKAKKEILITSGLHAREYQTPLLTMKQIEYYLYNMEEAKLDNYSFKSIFDEYAFHILPMCNPDGTELVQFGLKAINSSDLQKSIQNIYFSDKNLSYTDKSFEEYLLFWKANARGVDLNRNFDTESWVDLHYTSAPCFANYKGKKPLSEPETIAMSNYTNSLKNVVLSLAIHSQGEVIYFDCGQSNIHPSLKLAKAVSQVNGYFVMYETRAEAAFDDWCIINKGIPSVTIEISKFEVGTKPSLDQFETAFEKNKNLWLYMAIYDKQSCDEKNN